MHHAFAVLHLSPAAFWTMTPREWAAALPRKARSDPLSVETLVALIAQYPDQEDELFHG